MFYRALILLTLAALLSCNKLRNWKYNPPNVLLLSVEGLSRALPCYGDTIFQTPNIDRLAMRSLIFEDALAQHPTAEHALTSIYTGWYPRFFLNYPEKESYLNSLFPGLESGDYQIAFPGLKPQLHSAFDPTKTAHLSVEAGAATTATNGNSGITDYVLKLWSKYEGEPFFINAHYRMSALQNDTSGAGYQSALHEVDREIGRLLDELMERQEASNTIVILIGLNPMGVDIKDVERAHFMPRYVKVPFLYYDFQQDHSLRVSQLTELRSLFPTLSERCLEEEQNQPVCNAPTIPQILDKHFEENHYASTGLSNDTSFGASYTSGLLFLSGKEKPKELFSLSGPRAERLPKDSALMDSLMHIAGRKYIQSTAD